MFSCVLYENLELRNSRILFQLNEFLAHVQRFEKFYFCLNTKSNIRHSPWFIICVYDSLRIILYFENTCKMQTCEINIFILRFFIMLYLY